MDKDEVQIKEGEKRSRVFSSKIKAVNSEKGTVDVIMSDASIDRYREVIDPRAWKKGLANYKKHPVLLSSHNYHGLTNQIGKAETIKVNKEGQLEARMKYFIGKGNPEADWGFFLAEEGVAAYSVGFIPKKYIWNGDDGFEDLAKELGYSTKEAASIHLIFTEVELLENSHVLVPANPAGLLKGMESETVKNDEVLKGLYTEALDKIDSFKDFFATEGAIAISKGFEENDKKTGEDTPSGRIKRVKKDADTDSSEITTSDILAAIKTLTKEAEAPGLDSAKAKDILDAIKGLGDSTKEESVVKDVSSEEEVEDKSDTEEKDLEEAARAEEESDIEDTGNIEGKEIVKEMATILTTVDCEDIDSKYTDLAEKYKELGKEVPECKTYESMEDIATGCKDADTAFVLMQILTGVEDEPEDSLKMIEAVIEKGVSKINSLIKGAIEQLSNLTLKIEEDNTAKLNFFESELAAVKSVLTDLEENKIDIEEIKESSVGQMRELLSGIKNATAKISAKEVP